ncbi:MAG: phage terminase large subunit [Methanobrevibacter sp.]|nr:phage terminase large subunit [Methanobrevibacter sp.]
MEEEKKDILPSMSEEEKQKLLNSNGLSANNLLIPDVYKEIFLDNKRYFILSSGRISGKTSILVASWWVTTNKFPDRDIVVLQATATEIKDSIINEIEKFLRNSGFDVGDDPNCEWYIPKAKDRVIHKGQTGGTYFYPITDSKGGQRTRGITTTNKLSLVLFEEAQKNKDANVVEQSVATFIRQLDLQAKMIIVGNNETIGHWFIDYVNDKRQDPDWCYIYASCYNIWNLLNQQTRDYIDNYKKTNYVEFRRMFLGDINANTSDVVFPQFTRDKNYKKVYQITPQRIITLIVGIDHATANDTFAVVPVAILEDGTTQTLEVMYNDPEETQRTLAPTEQCDLLEEFMDFLDDKYGIAYNNLNTILSVDGAAAPFIAQLKHLKNTAKNKRLWKMIKIKSFTMKKKDINMGIIKNAFAYGVLVILNEGMYQWDKSLNKHRLAKEIEKQRYKNGKLDPAIKNDLCDALEYGLVPYYNNCYNISFPVRKKEFEQTSHYQDIQRLAKIIK